jgi:DNA-binding transcriptional LysR family regulator
MARPDFNQLVTLDALLSQGSVAGAARKLGLSPSAMSRALTRLRETMGDPLLVRAGRGLVPTPRAIELREHARALVQDVEAVLRPAQLVDLRSLKRTFVLRTSDGFVESFGPALLGRIANEAPGVRLRLVRKLDRDGSGLRDGSVDLETGVVGKALGPEVRTQKLFRDRFVGVVRAEHPFAGGSVTAISYAHAAHVVVARAEAAGGPVEEAMKPLGLSRRVLATVDGFSAALALARELDVVATVPERHTAGLRKGLESFLLPLEVPEILVSLLWHPRLDADPAHRWLRQCVRDACAERSNR